MESSKVHEFEQQVPGLTQGEGVFLSEFQGYQPVQGRFPTRPRPAGANPLNRDEYILHTVKRL